MQKRELEAGYFAVMQAKWRNAPQGFLPRLIFMERQGQHERFLFTYHFTSHLFGRPSNFMLPYAIIVFSLGLSWLVEIDVLLGGRLVCIGGWGGGRMGAKILSRLILV